MSGGFLFSTMNNMSKERQKVWMSGRVAFTGETEQRWCPGKGVIAGHWAPKNMFTKSSSICDSCFVSGF
jgi:hypothetical protein